MSPILAVVHKTIYGNGHIFNKKRLLSWDGALALQSGPFMNPSDLFLAGEIINGGVKLLSKDITQIGHFRRTYRFDTAE